MSARQSFFAASHFGVVGASSNRSKFGNKVLRWYIDHDLAVTPINPKESSIEGVSSVNSVSDLPDPSTTSLSIITPPSVTLSVLKEAIPMNFHSFWIQPGAEDEGVLEYIRSQGATDKVTLGGPCILVLGPNLLEEQQKKNKL